MKRWGWLMLLWGLLGVLLIGQLVGDSNMVRAEPLRQAPQPTATRPPMQPLPTPTAAPQLPPAEPTPEVSEPAPPSAITATPLLPAAGGGVSLLLWAALIVCGLAALLLGIEKRTR